MTASVCSDGGVCLTESLHNKFCVCVCLKWRQVCRYYDFFLFVTYCASGIFLTCAVSRSQCVFVSAAEKQSSHCKGETEKRREKLMCCCLFSYPAGLCVQLWPKSTPEVTAMAQFSSDRCSMSSALIWLWSDSRAAIFGSSLNASMENRCPLGVVFFFLFLILFSLLCLQTRCAAAVKQTNKQVCLCSKWLTDVGAVERQACGDRKMLVKM